MRLPRLANWLARKLIDSRVVPGFGVSRIRMLGKPDKVIGGPHDPYLLRWYLIPRNRFCNVYLHCFLRPDDDRALHDHPWPSLSILLRGFCVEHLPGGKQRFVDHGQIVYRGAKFAHRLWLPEGRRAWTLFITGPRIREWGFHCPNGWRHWKKFTAPGDPGQIGRGCD